MYINGMFALAVSDGVQDVPRKSVSTKVAQKKSATWRIRPHDSSRMHVLLVKYMFQKCIKWKFLLGTSFWQMSPVKMHACCHYMVPIYGYNVNKHGHNSTSSLQLSLCHWKYPYLFIYFCSELRFFLCLRHSSIRPIKNMFEKTCCLIRRVANFCGPY